MIVLFNGAFLGANAAHRLLVPAVVILPVIVVLSHCIHHRYHHTIYVVSLCYISCIVQWTFTTQAFIHLQNIVGFVKFTTSFADLVHQATVILRIVISIADYKH